MTHEKLEALHGDLIRLTQQLADSVLKNPDNAMLWNLKSQHRVIGVTLKALDALSTDLTRA